MMLFVLTYILIGISGFLPGEGVKFDECKGSVSFTKVILTKDRIELLNKHSKSTSLTASDLGTCLESCCKEKDCTEVIYHEKDCLAVQCPGKAGFCQYRPDSLSKDDIHMTILGEQKKDSSIGEQLDKLQFRNGPSLVTSDMKFTHAQQCGQYVEPENVTRVTSSWATYRFSKFPYLYQTPHKVPPLGMRSAVPLGGLGTGSFELRADGTFSEWTIENQSPAGSAKLGQGALDLAVLGVRVETPKESKASLLRTHPPKGFPGVEGLLYSGGFPVSKLGIKDKDFFGVKMELYAYGTLYARNASASAFPAVMFSLRVRNPTASPVKISLLLNLPLGEQPDTARHGDDISSWTLDGVKSSADCAAKCKDYKDCMAWALRDQQCVLHGDMPLHAYRKGITSGVKGLWNTHGESLTCTRPKHYPNSGSTTILAIHDQDVKMNDITNNNNKSQQVTNVTHAKPKLGRVNAHKNHLHSTNSDNNNSNEYYYYYNSHNTGQTGNSYSVTDNTKYRDNDNYYGNVNEQIIDHNNNDNTYNIPVATDNYDIDTSKVNSDNNNEDGYMSDYLHSYDDDNSDVNNNNNNDDNNVDDNGNSDSYFYEGNKKSIIGVPVDNYYYYLKKRRSRNSLSKNNPRDSAVKVYVPKAVSKNGTADIDEARRIHTEKNMNEMASNTDGNDNQKVNIAVKRKDVKKNRQRGENVRRTEKTSIKETTRFYNNSTSNETNFRPRNSKTNVSELNKGRNVIHIKSSMATKANTIKETVQKQGAKAYNGNTIYNSGNTIEGRYHGRDTGSIRYDDPKKQAQTASFGVSDDFQSLWSIFAKDGQLGDHIKNETGFHGSGVITRSLGPGEDGTLTLVMAWHYPCRDHAGETVGQYYGNIFMSSAEVANYAKNNLQQGLNELHSWRENMMPEKAPPPPQPHITTPDIIRVNSSIPDWLQDMFVNSLSYWRSGFRVSDGRWRQWEAFDCNDVDSVHNDFQRELPYIMFFPGLLEDVVRAWAKNQIYNGEIQETLQEQFGCWGRTNTLDKAGGRINMADVNPAFIAQVYHLYLWTGNTKLLNDLWPAIHKATNWMMIQSTSGTELPLRMTNTYDILRLEQYDNSMYNSVMYLLGLKAARKLALAKKSDTKKFVEHVDKSIRQAEKAIEERLWDAKRGYYHAWWDRKKGSPPWLMADSLYGQVWAYTLGLGDLLDSKNMKSHLQKEEELNDTPFGLRVITNGNVKKGKKRSVVIRRDNILNDIEGYYMDQNTPNYNRKNEYFRSWDSVYRRHPANNENDQDRALVSYRAYDFEPPLQRSYSPQITDYWYRRWVRDYENKIKERSAYKEMENAIQEKNRIGYRVSQGRQGRADWGQKPQLAFYEPTVQSQNSNQKSDITRTEPEALDKQTKQQHEQSKLNLELNKVNKMLKKALNDAMKAMPCYHYKKDSQFKSVWMGASPDWSALQIHMGEDPDVALKQAHKSMDHYRTGLKDLWNIHGLTAGSGYGLDGQPWCTSHYSFHMVLWHIPIALSGQQYSRVDRSLLFNPKVSVPYALPFFLPYASGTIEAQQKSKTVAYKISISHGYLVLKDLKISGATWPGGELKLLKGEFVAW